MAYEITEGIIQTAKKVVIYGPEGVGKSSFVSKFPKPGYIDTEGSTKFLNVKRLPKPTSWSMLIDEVKYVMNNRLFLTLVIDTADWAETLCIQHVCQSRGKSGIEDFGYGNGYTYVAEEWGRFLNLLQEVVDSGINVVLTCHSIVRKFEQPDEIGTYDRYELKLGKKTTGQTAPITKEWADMILFLNYRTLVVSADNDGKKKKAQGNERVMYTTHHPCWDAKNRYNLPEMCPLDYEVIRHIIEDTQVEKKEPVQEVSQPLMVETGEMQYDSVIKGLNETKVEIQIDPMIPRNVQDLMIASKVTEQEIQKAVGQRGYFPVDMPIRDYPRDFIEGVIIGAWPKILDAIEQNRNMQF